MLGLSQSWVSKVEQDETVQPRKLSEIAKLGGMSVAELIDENSNTSPGPAVRRTVPVISYIQAGQWKEFTEFQDMAEEEGLAYTTEPASRSAYALIVHGDAMVLIHPARLPTRKAQSLLLIRCFQECRACELCIDLSPKVQQCLSSWKLTALSSG